MRTKLQASKPQQWRCAAYGECLPLLLLLSQLPLNCRFLGRQRLLPTLLALPSLRLRTNECLREECNPDILEKVYASREGKD